MPFKGPLAGVVYILCWLRGSVEIPFYVGQTNRFSGRIRDYGIANFKASTDFHVGGAVKYWATVRNHRITVKYKTSANRLREEKEIIRDVLGSGAWLLNCCHRQMAEIGDDDP
jgi:hypothetical protein